MRYTIIALTLLASTAALAQPQPAQPQTPVSISILQNMVGNLAGQNAQLMEQVQHLAAENTTLKQELAAKKPAEPKKEGPK